MKKYICLAILLQCGIAACAQVTVKINEADYLLLIQAKEVCDSLRKENTENEKELPKKKKELSGIKKEVDDIKASLNNLRAPEKDWDLDKLRRLPTRFGKHDFEMALKEKDETDRTLSELKASANEAKKHDLKWFNDESKKQEKLFKEKRKKLDDLKKQLNFEKARFDTLKNKEEKTVNQFLAEFSEYVEQSFGSLSASKLERGIEEGNLLSDKDTCRNVTTTLKKVKAGKEQYDHILSFLNEPFDSARVKIELAKLENMEGLSEQQRIADIRSLRDNFDGYKNATVRLRNLIESINLDPKVSMWRNESPEDQTGILDLIKSVEEKKAKDIEMIGEYSFLSNLLNLYQEECQKSALGGGAVEQQILRLCKE